MTWDDENDVMNKTYEPIGTVTVTTSEYRDLIRAVYKARCDKAEYSDKYYEKYSEVSAKQKEIDTLKSEMSSYKKYFLTHPDVQVSYNEWEKMFKDDE